MSANDERGAPLRDSEGFAVPGSLVKSNATDSEGFAVPLPRASKSIPSNQSQIANGSDTKTNSEQASAASVTSPKSEPPQHGEKQTTDASMTTGPDAAAHAADLPTEARHDILALAIRAAENVTPAQVGCLAFPFTADALHSRTNSHILLPLIFIYVIFREIGPSRRQLRH